MRAPDGVDSPRGGPPSRGRVVVIAGPDGTGKSTLSDALERRLAARGPVRRIHHRPRALPGREALPAVVSEPHSVRPYPSYLAVVKLAYVWFDWVIGTAVRIRPFVRRGGWVIVERGWWDLVVDPRRYRLSHLEGLATRLGRWIPAPDFTLVLEGDAGILWERKKEIPRAEIERQRLTWRGLGRPGEPWVFVDAASKPEDVLAAALAALGLAPEVV